MATRDTFLPQAAEFPATNFPQSTIVGTTPRRPVLAFDSATEETCWWTFVAPQGLTGTLTLVLSYIMAATTSGGIRFGASIEAITSGDAFDLDAGSSFDTENAASDTGLPATIGYMEQLTITLTSADSIAAGDLCRLQLARKVAHADDTASGDCYILAAELRDGA